MIDGGVVFQLVPWQPTLDRRIGQHLTGIARDGAGIGIVRAHDKTWRSTLYFWRKEE
ncbi:hypothetical protein [Mesorhizobium sp. B4-1-4]|uniref:hypothetical protein n=1 Tax=Mesorhizobium sp. B4-1-4 TaxID=2589888 RepID=UPI0039AF559B